MLACPRPSKASLTPEASILCFPPIRGLGPAPYPNPCPPVGLQFAFHSASQGPQASLTSLSVQLTSFRLVSHLPFSYPGLGRLLNWSRTQPYLTYPSVFCKF
uniref:Uncharacterized protein n=1 Tax=Micrurus lemniscatus lemniscatus TaxID=129467 RepID=A0A2D4JHD8_MICLE